MHCVFDDPDHERVALVGESPWVEPVDPGEREQVAFVATNPGRRLPGLADYPPSSSSSPFLDVSFSQLVTCSA